MSYYFGRNAWSNGPPGLGPGSGPSSGPGSGTELGGARVTVAGTVGNGPGGVRSVAVSQAFKDAKALMYQRKKREENRLNYQEPLKRDVVKEKNCQAQFQ